MAIKTIISTFVAITVAAAYALPSQRAIRTAELNDVVNKTTCPIKVEYNKDDNRVPRIIKMMKCEAQTQLYCKDQNIPEHECCHHYHNNHVMECVEIKDTVVVFYKDTSETKLMEVSVGCTCLIEKSTMAESIPT